MAKRIIVECDLSKNEYDPEETVTIIIKRKDKSKGRSYDLSPESAMTLETQLVAGPQLDKNWRFVSVLKDNEYSGKTLADLDKENTGDAYVIAEKKAELKEAGIIDDVVVENSTSSCSHLNKGRIQTTLRNNKRFVFRICKQCGNRIQELTAEDKTNYMKAKITESDIHIRDITK